MVSARSNKCPVCGAALAIACTALVLCVALIRWLGR
jgi:hypothetical protein